MSVTTLRGRYNWKDWRIQKRLWGLQFVWLLNVYALTYKAEILPMRRKSLFNQTINLTWIIMQFVQKFHLNPPSHVNTPFVKFLDPRQICKWQSIATTSGRSAILSIVYPCAELLTCMTNREERRQKTKTLAYMYIPHVLTVWDLAYLFSDLECHYLKVSTAFDNQGWCTAEHHI